MEISGVGSTDPRLVILSALLAFFASYTFLELVDRVTSTFGGRRVGWTIAGAVAGGVGAWSTGAVAMLALRRSVAYMYDVRLLVAALVFGLVASGFAILAAAGREFRFRRLICGGLVLGVALVGTNDIDLIAVHGNLPTKYDVPLLLVSMMIAVSASVVAFFTGVRLHDRSPSLRIALRALAAGLLSIGITALYYMSTVAADIRSNMTPQPYPAGNTPLAIALALATFLTLLGMFAGSVLDERARKFNELYVRERNITTTLQQALLPMRLPSVTGVQFSNAYLPQSEESEVGGDWYDAFELSDGRLAFSIGDVAGHGLSAALSMNVVRHALRAAAIEDATPANVLARANRILHASDYPSIVTATFAVLDPVTLQLDYAGAGHPPGIFATQAGVIGQLANSDPPLGVLDDLSVTEHHVVLAPGTLLALYTDGVTEYDRDAIVGERRLREAVRAICAQNSGEPAAALARRIFARHERNDDAAILCVACSPTLPHLDLRGGTADVSPSALRNALDRFLTGLGMPTERRSTISRIMNEMILALETSSQHLPYISLGVRAAAEEERARVVFRDWRRPAITSLAGVMAAHAEKNVFDELSTEYHDDVTTVECVFSIKYQAARTRRV